MYYLTENDVQEIQKLRRKVNRDNLQRPREGGRDLPFRYETAYIAKTGSAIPARTGDTPGTGEVTLYDVNDDGDLETIKDAEGQDRTKDVYNPHEGPILGSSFTRIILFGNHWFIASPPTAFIAKTGSAIAAMASSTPGSGTVTLYYIDSDGDLVSAGTSVTAFNIANGEVAGDTFIQVKLCSGKWIIDFESCPA